MNFRFLYRLITPGILPSRTIYFASMLTIFGVFALNATMPADIYLHMLYVFPLAAIALHCKDISSSVGAIALSLTFQLLAFSIQGIHSDNIVFDAGISLATFMLTVFLSRAARNNHLTTVDMATTDALTRVHNRQSFEPIIEMEIARQKRYGNVFSLVTLDLDNFKFLNASRGHYIGDRALMLTADVLRENTRETDSIARLGGDEFTILMPNTKETDCVSLCQQLSVKIAKKMIEAGYATTVSIGCTTFENVPESTAEALQKADKAMYVAKANFKSRTGS